MGGKQERPPVKQLLVWSGDGFVAGPQGLHMVPRLGLGPQGTLPDCSHGSAHPAPSGLLTPHSLRGLCANRHCVGPLGQCLFGRHAAIREGLASRTSHTQQGELASLAGDQY